MAICTPILVHFRDETSALCPEATPARFAEPADKAAPPDATTGTLEQARVFQPNAASVWVWLDCRWQEGRFEMFQQQIDRLTRERDEARELCSFYATSGGSTDRWKELRGKAKRDGWMP